MTRTHTFLLQNIVWKGLIKSLFPSEISQGRPPSHAFLSEFLSTKLWQNNSLSSKHLTAFPVQTSKHFHNPPQNSKVRSVTAIFPEPISSLAYLLLMWKTTSDLRRIGGLFQLTVYSPSLRQARAEAQGRNLEAGTKVSVPPGPIAVQSQRNTQSTTLIKKHGLVYYLRLLINSYSLH